MLGVLPGNIIGVLKIMKDKIMWFWSCKLKRPETLKRHKTFDVAARRVGDHGFVFSEEDKSVKQVFMLSNNTLRGVDVDKQMDRCNTGGFDMRKALKDAGVI
jgi:hypothetical protein